ncbi:hypothetical protein EVJ58_g6020 [Rhodofomes roseus]|uniref:Uncharacterized protein n=1 Tax=Rhodofomes roseus TaxID=34475 RepID=A0A4Y9YBU6_9APHY|nr:hypothetical protein EVJ58_g6020 [Rhodofomes roseus]
MVRKVVHTNPDPAGLTRAFEGERTPVGVRMADPPASIPKHWMFCHTARNFRAAVSSATPSIPGVRGPVGGGEAQQQESLRTVRVVERPDGTAAPGECLLGELTDIGRQLRIRNGKDENLFGNTLACKRLEILQVGFAKAAASEWNDTLAPLDKKLSKYIGGNPVRLDGKPRASGILDTVRAANAHGIAVPPELKDPAVVDLIEKAVVHEWFAGCEMLAPYHQTEEVRRLGMGPLLSDLSRKMQAKAMNASGDSLKILIHSTHDTCLAALCSTLDVFDNRWPAFSSAVTFELFRRRMQPERQQQSIWQSVLAPFRQHADTPTEHYVRMRYQNRNLPLPVCAEDGKHLPGSPEFCTLAAFQERIRELTPVDWDAECAPAGLHGKHGGR